jgi:hypothetical protein
LTAVDAAAVRDAHALVIAAMSDRAKALVKLWGPLMRRAGGDTSVVAVRAARMAGRVKGHKVLVVFTPASVILCDQRRTRELPLDGLEVERVKKGARLRSSESDPWITLEHEGDADLVPLVLAAGECMHERSDEPPVGGDAEAVEEPAAPQLRLAPPAAVVTPRVPDEAPSAPARTISAPYVAAQPTPVEAAPTPAPPKADEKLVVVRTVLDPVGYVEVDGILRPAVWSGAGAAPLPGEPICVAGDAGGKPIEVSEAAVAGGAEGKSNG